MAFKFLIIADERKGRRIIPSELASDSCQVLVANSRRAVSDLLMQHGFHAACVDLRMGDEQAQPIVEFLRQRMPRLPILALLAERENALSPRLQTLGFSAWLATPCPIEMLRKSLTTLAVSDKFTPAPPAVSAPAIATPGKIVARDDVARRMLEVALRAASSNVSILILGETGTGKNLLAQTIHEQSALRQKPFVTVSCPSLNAELLESDLFGHVRGSFTGAVQDTWGKVAAAEGGTLFLDEIGDLPPALQPKLLRLLQDKQYERVGETTPRRANVRIIAATNRDLKAEVAAGRFREDLFYRLNVITIEVPPLRRRACDILAGADMFLDAICRQMGKRRPSFTTEARRLLESYAWPGNLRELRNVVERAAVLSDGPVLDTDDFPMLTAQPAETGLQVGAAISLRALEAAHIQLVVARSATLEEAARILEIDKSTLYRKRKAMEAQIEKFVPADDAVVAVGR